MSRAWGPALLLVLLGAAGVAGQEGRVVEAESGTAVSFAELVWLAEDGTPRQRIEAGMDGRFTVPTGWMAPGRIQVRALGRRPVTLTLEDARAAAWVIGLEADPLELDAVVVTAGGRAQRRSEVAVPITSIAAPEIRVEAATSAASLLSDVPGLQSTSGTPVGSNIQIRGIGDSRVLILVDGQPAGGALLENRDLGRMSLAGVERIEVVKGPLSALYGSDALGGVINVITRTPDRGLRAEGRALSGGAGRYEADVSLSGGGDLRYRVTASWRQQDEVAGVVDPVDAFSRVWDARATVRYDSEGPVRLRTDVNVVRERQRWPVGGGFSGFNDNRGVTAWTEATWVRPGGSWSARILAQDYEHLYRSARGTAPIAGSEEDLQVERLWKGTLAWQTSAGGHDLDVGIDLARRSIRSPDKILEDRAADDQVELFAQDAWSVGAATLSGGLRGTFNDRWGTAVTPSIGVSVLPSSRVRLRALVGRGFRAPSFKELAWDFANLGAGYTVQGHADLEPETSWNVTAGADWAPVNELALGFEVYHNRIANLIQSTFVGNEPGGLLIYSPRNLLRARTRGIEATATWRIAGWDVHGEYVLLDTRSLEDDLPLDRRARHSGRLRVRRLLPVAPGGTMVAVTGRYTGSAPLIGPDGEGRATQIGAQAAFPAVDASVSIGLPRSLRLVLGVDNLLDHRPDGWQSLTERRARIGLEVGEIL